MELLFNQDCLQFMDSSFFCELNKRRKVVIVTDPPFNIGYHYKSYKDRLKEQEYYNLLKSVFTKFEIPFVVVHYPEPLFKIANITNCFPERVVSWVYNSNTSRQHRDIAYFKIKPDFKQMIQPYKNLTDKRIKERISRGILGGKLYDWWEINQVKNVSKNKNTINHPCVMPVEVMKRVVGILPKDIVVYDPFCGTGTTGIACKELGIDFIGTEIDTEYYEQAKKRLEI